jgi:hypothetical protein
MRCYIGVEVDHTPKCLCKITGEGNEHTWACSKNSFHITLLGRKRGRENFRLRLEIVYQQVLIQKFNMKIP